MKILEQRFLEIFKDYQIEFSINTFPNRIIIYNSIGEWLMYLGNTTSNSLISYSIKTIFIKEYNMNDLKFSFFITNMLSKYFKLKKDKYFL